MLNWEDKYGGINLGTTSKNKKNRFFYDGMDVTCTKCGERPANNAFQICKKCRTTKCEECGKEFTMNLKTGLGVKLCADHRYQMPKGVSYPPVDRTWF